MTTKYLLSFTLILTTLWASAKCDNTYTSASYALNHTKKSISAKNFDHQKYYAYKALEALEKAKRLIETCGCDKAEDPILDGIEHLQKASDPKDFEMGRYYTKKAFDDIQDLINQLDIFTQDDLNAIDNSVVPMQTENVDKKLLQKELSQIKNQQLILARKLEILEKRKKEIEEKLINSSY
ncbi:MAG: hypothetical protein JSV59_14275 [Flavobacteriaceae bacterium]|nr:MAG: hypothetical protein JSV59_14275 [Flavobacteriaceae bacterium]